MTTENNSTCLEYIGNQIQAFLVNRLAQAPATTAQLVGTFSLLVDSLSISENSLVYALDALYKKKVVTFENRNGNRLYYLVNKVVTFENRNGNRLYYLVNFDDDYIFELNIDKVEELIAEYKLPYFSDHRKNVEEPLYFEARKNRTCIYINAPIPVTLPESKVENDDISNKTVEENTSDSAVEDLVETTSNELVSSDLTTDANIKNEEVNTSYSEVLDENTAGNKHFDTEDITNNNVGNDENSTNNDTSDNDYLAIFNELKNDNQVKNDDESTTSSLEETKENEADSNIINAVEESEQNSTTQLDSNVSILSEETTESSQEIDQSQTVEDEYKSNFDSIDFSSYDTFLRSTNYSRSSSNSIDSIDLIDQLFGKALAEASGKTNQQTEVTETSENYAEALDTTETSEIFNPETVTDNVVLENDILENNTVSSTELHTSESIDNQQFSADDIVFTEVQLETPPPLSTEEQLEKMERAMRVFEEYAEANSAKNSEEEQSEENSEEDQDPYFIPESVQTEVQTPRPIPETPRDLELEILKKYISEEERINSYDWEKRLVRAFIDVNNEEDEEEKKKDEPSLTATYSELKSLMAKKNIVFKAYPNHESKSFYSENYVFTNRLAKDTSIYTYIFMVIEILLAYFLVDPKISKGFPFYLICGVVLIIVPLFFIARYYLFRDRRKPANFVFRLSLVTALMIYVNLMVMVVLVAFFVPSLSVNVNDLSTMILTIFYPAVLFLNIPISVCIYSILYRSKKYHLH